MCSYAFIYSIVVCVIGVFLRYVYYKDFFECYACKEYDSLNMEYDYIIVGGGSAGSIVARRLSEDKKIKVLLLEAGSQSNSLLHVPPVGFFLQRSLFDWQYKTTPQKNACFAFKDQVSRWPMGKILGGTGMLNNMVYVRAHRKDFARWFQDLPDFDYEKDIRPYFELVEGFNNEASNSSIMITEPPYLSPLSNGIMEAAESMGFPRTPGLEPDLGFSTPKSTMFRGKRWTPYTRLSSLKLPNLVVRSKTVVEKVLIRSTNVAYGVKYEHLGDHYYAKASKGVILSAGTIGTPKILMLSGIGPKQHLSRMKITPKIDLPVGNNLQDHVTTGIDLVVLNTTLGLGLTGILSQMSAWSYFVNSKGPWTTTGCENVAFFATQEGMLPDLQLMVVPLGMSADYGVFLRYSIGLKEKIWHEYFDKIDGIGVSILPIVLHPKSRGSVRLQSNNPKKPLLIDPNYLTDKYDVDIIIKGIEMIKELIKTEPMQKLGAKLNENVFPGCEKFVFDTRPYWECYVRHLTVTVYHPVGTCQMGAVTDFEFRVKGVENLYVVDGSVLPDLPSGNPNSAIMLMAEKASDLIRHHGLNVLKCKAKDIFLD